MRGSKLNPDHAASAESQPESEKHCRTCRCRMRRAEYHESEFPLIPPHGQGGKVYTFAAYQGPLEYARIVELLYSHPLTPWRTYSDVARAFLDLGCETFGPAVAKLPGEDGGEAARVIPGRLHSLAMINRLVDEAREANDFAQSLDALEREAKRMVDGDRRESAVGLVYQYRDRAKQFPDRVLRRKLVSDINQRFAYLLKGDQGRRESEKAAAGSSGGGKRSRLTEVDHDED